MVVRRCGLRFLVHSILGIHIPTFTVASMMSIGSSTNPLSTARMTWLDPVVLKIGMRRDQR